MIGVKLLPGGLLRACCWLALVAAAGCNQVTVAAVPAPLATPGTPAAALAGRVAFPQSLAASAHLIPTGIGGLIPTGIGAVTASAPGRFRTLGLDAAGVDQELPVAGAVVFLLDATTHKRLAGYDAVHTDANGRFALSAAPAANVLVAVVFHAPDRAHAFRMLALARAGTSPEVVVSWRSTTLLASLPASTDLATVEPGALAAREGELAAALAARTAADRDLTLSRTLVFDAAMLPADDSAPTEPLPLPSFSPRYPGFTPGPAASAGGAIAPHSLVSPVGSIPLPSVPAPLASAVTGLTAAVVQPRIAAAAAKQQVVTLLAAPVAGAASLPTQLAPVTGLVSGLSSALTATPTPKPQVTPQPSGPTASPAPLASTLGALLHPIGL